MRSDFRFPLPGLLCALSLLLAACGGSGDGANDNTDSRATEAPGETAAPLRTVQDYCPGAGRATATRLTEPGFELTGPNAIASEGDYILANDRALFAITGMGEQKTYYHYPGILVDAVALKDCRQDSEEHFFELPLMVGKLNAVEQHRSTFRAFKAESIEVLNDGSNGDAAIIRATGADNYYWLLELTLMGDAVLAAEPKYLSEPFDLKLVVDYILEPDSSTLKIEYNLINTRRGFNSYNIAFVLMASGQGPTLNTFSAFDVDLAGLGLQHRIPWVTTNENGNAYVYSADTDVLTTTRIAGVDALLDANQMANTFLGQFLSPAGEDGDSRQQRFFVTVTNADEYNAVRTHVDNVPMVSEVVDTPVSVQVTDSLSGDPVPRARIQFQTKKQRFLEGWPWETFLTAYADENGYFSGSVPVFKYLQDQVYRVVVSAPGRVDSVPVPLYRADQADPLAQQLDISLEGQGELAYSIVDENGAGMPAKITLFQNGEVVERIYSISGEGRQPLAPGTYQVGVSRGFEYGIHNTEITVPAFATTTLNATLKHWVNTEGYLSYDAHVHSAPSPDSEVSKEDRIRTAVTAGLEIVVATDHEIITDLAPAVSNVGADNYIATIIGQEVTASLPNHTIAFPLNPDPAKTRDFIPWYGLDIAEVFAAEKAAGARIRTFAHPRGEYLDIIEWDRIAGAPAANLNPASLGLPADAALWSWDFEAMEYMNGRQKVFSSGIFEDWMSFLNHGHRIIATGASDVHDYMTPGSPRTYFRSSTDHPPAFDIDEMVASVTGGDVVVSFGAFARVGINGVAGLGDTVTDTDGEVQLNLRIEAIPEIDVDHARIYVNCDEVARVTTSNPEDSAIKFSDDITIPVPVDTDAHVVVLGFGKDRLPAVFEQFDPAETPRVTTNPVFVDTDGNGVFDAPGGKACAI
ncbi:MAG: CehA/McbA family metallohydrolase [Ketobacteraceae bacterium]|nr:CehA/McbA family metallohydrolase [Ketobacteraceae bacterium]